MVAVQLINQYAAYRRKHYITPR